MTKEIVHLDWKKFEESTLSAFKNLWTSEDFVDVTLVCANGQPMKAHKVILSSCSPFFKNLFMLNVHQHPLIYLKGIEYKHLKLLVEFIYSGEVNIEKDDLTCFLDTADELQISGLTRSSEMQPNDTDVFEKENQASETPTLKLDKFGVNKEGLNLNMKKLHGTSSWEFEKNKEYAIASGPSNRSATLETVFNMEDGSMSQTENTSEGHFCDRCDIEERSGMALMKHRKEEHPGMDYLCNICGKEFTRHHKLKVHKVAIHDNIKFSCESCDKAFNAKSYLAMHRKRHNE